jgi:hypothetical protein
VGGTRSDCAFLADTVVQVGDPGGVEHAGQLELGVVGAEVQLLERRQAAAGAWLSGITRAVAVAVATTTVPVSSSDASRNTRSPSR